ncbi:SAM-dependent methyltransferase [Paenibacillus phyllosphaerae]|uniref:SAM-dependent methyltransferase n=1 Tax=Paenibacillus phyllosphaerae TaxID=274593 RepID=A0A7W5AZY0_9BACL|nr:class I SAM-dependent methyltransferase [Paenibacillus phyllosphaerae]MBB3111875.1 SAM-dependent methyltransferase [Paenibacillus phyllosphaerae]
MMNKENELKQLWLQEARRTFSGWDFAHIAARTTEQPLPWDYRTAVQAAMSPSRQILDMGTGGGEFLLSLSPPPGRTYATESYPPNVMLCQERLPAHGIEIRQVFDDNELPFPDESFDLVINRHESYAAEEVYRILKPGGRFLTQQVGGMNNRELAGFVLGKETEASPIDRKFGLDQSAAALQQAGFTIQEGHEFFPLLTFHDVGAFVYFATIIEWEFPGFTVERCFPQLLALQAVTERKGGFTSREHRFFLVAGKQLAS